MRITRSTGFEAAFECGYWNLRGAAKLEKVRADILMRLSRARPAACMILYKTQHDRENSLKCVYVWWLGFRHQRCGRLIDYRS